MRITVKKLKDLERARANTMDAHTCPTLRVSASSLGICVMPQTQKGTQHVPFFSQPGIMLVYILQIK